MNRLKPTPTQLHRLERQLQDTPDRCVYRRTLAVLEYNRGRSVAGIARSLGVTPQSVYNGIEAYGQNPHPSSLWDEAKPGRPRLWSEARLTLLSALLEISPDKLGCFAVDWTVPLLQEHLQHCTGVRLSDDTIRRELQRRGYVWKRSRYILAPDPDKEKKTPDSCSDPAVASEECAAV